MQTGISASIERTSSFVTTSSVSPFTRAAKRRATASSQPQRRGRPVTVPNSPPAMRSASAASGSASLGKGPSPTRVRYAFATPITAVMRVGPMPRPTQAPPAIGFDEVTNG